jgi:hypothetical protein
MVPGRSVRDLIITHCLHYSFSFLFHFVVVVMFNARGRDITGLM